MVCFVPRSRLRTTILVAALASCLAPGWATAQSPFDSITRGLGLDTGALLFHGNYCGPGSRAELPPIDALDAACMHHDACSPPADSGRLPACGCNRRLRVESLRVARDRSEPDDLRLTAKSVADGALLLPCR